MVAVLALVKGVRNVLPPPGVANDACDAQGVSSGGELPGAQAAAPSPDRPPTPARRAWACAAGMCHPTAQHALTRMGVSEGIAPTGPDCARHSVSFAGVPGLRRPA